ncbi:MAG: glycosyltransferase family 2 protein [Bacteroidales bacterium]
MKITPVIIAKNAIRTISKTLGALTDFDEVILLDTGSTDGTDIVAGGFSNVRLFYDVFDGFGKSKNKAACFARNDWILSIDADEILGPGLINSIKNLELSNDTIYRWKRVNFYGGRKIKYSGWGNEYVARLYNRKTTKFNNKLVHESLITSGLKIKTIPGSMDHFSYHSISDFSKKREMYSDLFAIENVGRKKSSPFKAITHSFYEFCKTYFLKLGFLDGYNGLLIGVFNAYVTFIKYFKLYEANLNAIAGVNSALQPNRTAIHQLPANKIFSGSLADDSLTLKKLSILLDT